jgi:hypothetical protein
MVCQTSSFKSSSRSHMGLGDRIRRVACDGPGLERVSRSREGAGGATLTLGKLMGCGSSGSSSLSQVKLVSVVLGPCSFSFPFLDVRTAEALVPCSLVVEYCWVCAALKERAFVALFLKGFSNASLNFLTLTCPNPGRFCS